jgi:hypothetical protein
MSVDESEREGKGVVRMEERREREKCKRWREDCMHIEGEETEREGKENKEFCQTLLNKAHTRAHTHTHTSRGSAVI